jgi:hypothetical protein
LSAALTGKRLRAPLLLGALVVALLLLAPAASGHGSKLGLSMNARLQGNLVSVEVTATAKASVTIRGTFDGRAAGPAQTTRVEPGQVGRVSLPLSVALRRQLAKLPSDEKLSLALQAKGRSAAGVTTTVKLELEIPGRKSTKGSPRRS